MRGMHWANWTKNGEMGCDDVDGIYMSDDKDQWGAVVNMIMNLRVS